MMHFWYRKQGDLLPDRLSPLWAKLETGVIVRYHFCGRNRRSVEALLDGGVFRWQYLGVGEIEDRLSDLGMRPMSIATKSCPDTPGLTIPKHQKPHFPGGLY